jgi:hypothetical protein
MLMFVLSQTLGAPITILYPKPTATFVTVMNHLKALPLQLSLTLGITLSALLTALPSQAADRITFIIPFIGARSITLNQLQNLAETGEATGDLRTIINIADKTPEEASEFLKKPISFELVTADRILNSKPGESLLDQLGKILAPRNSNRLGAQALRAAITLSLAGDNQFTILELVEKYPTDARVNVQELIDAGDRFGDISNFIGTFTEQ